MIGTELKELSFLFPERVAAMLMAPSALASSIAAMPTLLLAAVMSTKSPLKSLPSRINAPYAVRYCIQIDVPSSEER